MLKNFIEIVEIRGREIIDSRGNPTLEVQVVVCDDDGKHHTAIAAVPTGALDLRDGGDRYNGLGVEKAVMNINDRIADEICGMNALDQVAVDQKMLEHDGTPNKENLGGNAILGVSLAVAKAAAIAFKLPLYQYLGGFSARSLPVPMVNVLTMDTQEFLIMPVGAASFKEALQWSAEIYSTVKAKTRELSNTDEAREFILEAVEAAGYEPDTEICITTDSELREDPNVTLVKINEIGTLTETFDLISQAQRNGMNAIIYSSDSETEDTTIADIAVAVNAGQIKIGSLTGANIAKYNQLLRIEEELEDVVEYSGLNSEVQ